MLTNYDIICMTKGDLMKLTQKDIYQFIANGKMLKLLTQDQISALPDDTLNKFVENGGIIPESLRDELLERISQDTINRVAAKGGNISWFTDAQRAAIPQEIINQFFLNKGYEHLRYNSRSFYINNSTIIESVPDLSSFDQLKDIPQEIIDQHVANLGYLPNWLKEIASTEAIHEYVANGGQLDYFTDDEIENFPQDVVNRRVANDHLLYGISKQHIKRVPQKYINERVAKGGDIDMFTISQKARVPQELINERVKQGGYMSDLLPSQKGKIPDEIIIQYIKNGGNYSNDDLLPRQKACIPQDLINERVATGRDEDLMSDILPKQKANIPHTAIVKYIENHGDLFYLSPEEKANLTENEIIENMAYYDRLKVSLLTPKETIDKYVAFGLHIEYLSPKQIANISQGAINQRALNGYSLTNLPPERIARIPQANINQYVAHVGSCYGISDEQRMLIPKQIREITEEGRTALILYSLGKIKSNELPANVYLNPDLRNELLNIIKKRMIDQYEQICQTNGYIEKVPDEVKESFDRKLKEVKKSVEHKMQECLAEVNKQTKKDLSENDISETIYEIGVMEGL